MRRCFNPINKNTVCGMEQTSNSKILWYLFGKAKALWRILHVCSVRNLPWNSELCFSLLISQDGICFWWHFMHLKYAQGMHFRSWACPTPVWGSMIIIYLYWYVTFKPLACGSNNFWVQLWNNKLFPEWVDYSDVLSPLEASFALVLKFIRGGIGMPLAITLGVS